MTEVPVILYDSEQDRVENLDRRILRWVKTYQEYQTMPYGDSQQRFEYLLE